MNCSRFHKLVADDLATTLKPALRMQMEQHMRDCPTCREHYTSMQTLWKSMGEIPDSPPDPDMNTRFFSSLERWQREEYASASTAHTARLSSWFNSTGWLIAAGSSAAVLMMLGLGILIGWNLAFKSSPDSDPELSTVDELHRKVSALEREMALSLMHQESASERLRGVLLSGQLAPTEASVIQALLQTLDTDPNVNVRLAALEVLQPHLDRPEIRHSLPESLLRQSAPILQAELIRLILQLEDPKATNALRELLERNHLEDYIRSTAESGISQLEMI